MESPVFAGLSLSDGSRTLRCAYRCARCTTKTTTL